MQVPVQATRQGGGLAYKWVVAIVVIFGIFMSVLDSTIVNIAIPRLQGAFGADLNSVQWVLTGYTLAQGVATPLTAFFADRFGTKRFYIIALLGFTIGSALCGIAWSLPVLIFFRILQGAGGAFLMPLSITLLYTEFPPEERGTAMGALGIPILLAPAFGPTVGGYIVTFAGWQLIFYINVPIGILGAILSAIYLRESRPETRTRFDIPGFIFSAAGLGLLLYGLSDASTDGWGSTKVLSCLILGALLLIVFVFVELDVIRREGKPLLDLRVFKYASFSTGSLASLLVTFALYGGLFLVPVYLQSLRGLSAYQSGLILLPQAFASMIAVIVGGRLVDRIGVRAVVIPGLVILAVVSWLLTTLNLTMPYSQFQFYLILRGFSLGLCMQPLMVAALSDIQPRMLSQASSVSTTLRFVGSSLAVAIVSTLVQTQSKIHFSHLAELVTPNSPLGRMLLQLQAVFVARGADLNSAHAAAAHEIAGILQRQGYVLAMQDAFWLTLALSIVAIIASFFVRSARRQPPVPENRPVSTAEREEEERAREEALLAV